MGGVFFGRTGDLQCVSVYPRKPRPSKGASPSFRPRPATWSRASARASATAARVKSTSSWERPLSRCSARSRARSARARIGASSILHPGVTIYPDCVVGDRVVQVERRTGVIRPSAERFNGVLT